MSKYNVGDVVKLRADLKDLDWKWEKLKNIPLLINDKCEINGNGRYLVDEEWLLWASVEMIEGLWEECKSSEQVSKSEGKLKLIDVLNMIAKGELKEGTKVKYKNIEWEYKTFGNKGEKDLADRGNFTLFEQFYMDALSDEVELIEPPCKKCGLEEVTEECVAEADETIEPAKIEELIDWYATTNDNKSNEMLLHIVWNKLNEVIRVINKE